MKEQAKYIVDGLLEGIKEKWTGFIEYWGKKKDEIVKKFEKIKEDFSKKGKEIIDGIKAGIAEKWSAFKEDWSKKKNNIVDAFKDIKEKFKAKGNSIISGIKSGIAEKWSDFSAYWKAKKDKIVDTFKTIKEKFKSKGGSIISGIKAGIAEKWSDFSTYWKGKKDKVVDAFKNIKEDFKKKGKDIINGIIEGIQAVWNKITSWADKIKSAFSIKVNAGSGGTQASTAPSTYSMNGLKIPKPVNMPIPYLATGAVIPPNAPFMAMLGDQKKGTNVEAPLETIKQAVRDVMRENGRGKGATYSFTAKLDRRTIFNEVITEAKLRQGQSGRNPFELA